MPDLTVKRTLVKSPPELWSELSEVDSLARHLDRFGEIEISRLEPERRVAWEGEHARGTVEIEASAWGTKVTLKAELEGAEPEPEPEPEPESVAEQVPEPEPDLAPAPRVNFFSRWLYRQRSSAPEPVVVVEPEPEPIPEPVAVVPAPEPPAEPAGLAEDEALAVLEGALDNLGAAHHRPFSRG